MADDSAPEEVRRLDEAIEALAGMDDDEACAKAVSLVLDQWPEHGKRLRAIRQERVKRLRDRRMTWAAIGALLVRRNGKGVTGARAQQIAEGLSGHSREKRKDQAAEDAAEK